MCSQFVFEKLLKISIADLQEIRRNGKSPTHSSRSSAHNQQFRECHVHLESITGQKYIKLFDYFEKTMLYRGLPVNV